MRHRANAECGIPHGVSFFARGSKRQGSFKKKALRERNLKAFELRNGVARVADAGVQRVRDGGLGHGGKPRTWRGCGRHGCGCRFVRFVGVSAGRGLVG